MCLQTVLEVQRGAEAIAENYKHSYLESKEQYDAMYKQSIEDPESFWSDIAKEFYWKKQVHLQPICAVLETEGSKWKKISLGNNMIRANVNAVGGQAHQLQF